MQSHAFAAHQQIPNGAGRSLPGEATVDSSKTGASPQGDVQVGHVTKAHEWLGVGSDGGEIDSVGNPIRPGSALSSDDRPDTGVPKGIVQVSEPVLIPASHVLAA
jgi:hypothetical protein